MKLGPYEIISSAGAGGQGEVYKARDTRLDRLVAIKILPSHLADRPELRERFEREARTIASLNHDHICTLYDIGHQEGTAAEASRGAGDSGSDAPGARGGIDFLVLEYQ